MIKPSYRFFNKTVSKQSKKDTPKPQIDPTKTRPFYLKFAKNNGDITTIIQDLQKNLKQLKIFHQSLQKSSKIQLRKSLSLSEINKLRGSTKTKSKQYQIKNNNRFYKRYSQSHKNNQKLSQKIKDKVIQSTLSKNLCQNGSTMLSIHNVDVDEVKKVYQLAYGRKNSNIIDLYNFFKKNMQKNYGLNCGSIEMSTCPHAEYSEDLIKSRQQPNHRKSNQFLNVIIEDKSQKQPHYSISNQMPDQSPSSPSTYKLAAQRNSTIEEIFKGGCPDLANVYDFVKKRRVSLKNYINVNKNKQNRAQIANFPQIEQYPNSKRYLKNIEPTIHFKNHIKFGQEEQKQNFKEFENPFNNLLSPCADKRSQRTKQSEIEGPTLSQQKYLPIKGSNKSQKSSIKKSKQKNHLIDLNQNLSSNEISQFNRTNDQKDKSKIQNNIQNQDHPKQIQFCMLDDPIQQKYRKSKYYVQPVPLKKQNSLQGCSISVKSTSRIIELDFIPLDL